jgi:hypothetical protein
MFLRKGSTLLTNDALEVSSFNSNNRLLAAFAITFSHRRNSLLTLILSNADAYPRAVLSPKSTIPEPGNETIGFTLSTYS